jgi:hypothetical protein
VEVERVDLTDFDGIHAGEDVWVVGSDASVDWFPEGFWEGRTVVGVNKVPMLLPCAYCVTKADRQKDGGSRWIQEQVEALPNLPHIVSKHPNGHIPYGLTEVYGPNVTYFDHEQNRVQHFDAAKDIPSDSGRLLVSWSTLGSALHFAARLGARTVFIAGGSGGRFGEEWNLATYYKTPENTGALAGMSMQAQAIADRLHEMYGTTFVTVLPWANLWFGGVKFQADYGAIN